jgi:hypothetical protein
MSLDVYLTLAGGSDDQHARIYVREDGQTKEITREEWDTRYPGTEPYTVLPDPTSSEVWSGNITHNLAPMAVQADIYKELWRPEELGITQAKQLIEPLQHAFTKLLHNKQYYEKFNPENGWGTFELLVSFIKDYLDACCKYPEATVSVWR